MTVVDQAVRDRALDIGKSFAVSAPAGSGKTGLLVRRILRLLATCDTPEQVLAITFTRKAAAEMQERIVDALNSARSGDEPEDVTARVAGDTAEWTERDGRNRRTAAGFHRVAPDGRAGLVGDRGEKFTGAVCEQESLGPRLAGDGDRLPRTRLLHRRGVVVFPTHREVVAPECAAPTDEPDALNRFTGTVQNVDYQGRDVVYYVHVPDFDRVIEVSGKSSRSATTVLDEGATVWLSAEPADLVYTAPEGRVQRAEATA